MIKNFKLFSESILWYKSGKFVKDDSFELPRNEYSPAEQFFLEQITDLEEVRSNKYPNSIFFKKNGEILFEYIKKDKFFWCHYNEIWSVLMEKFNLSYGDVQELIKGIIEKHLDLRGVLPITYPTVNSHWWENIQI